MHGPRVVFVRFALHSIYLQLLTDVRRVLFQDPAERPHHVRASLRLIRPMSFLWLKSGLVLKV